MSGPARLELRTTLRQFEEAWQQVTRARPRTPTVRINTDTLRALLMDHSQMAGKLGFMEYEQRRNTPS